MRGLLALLLLGLLAGAAEAQPRAACPCAAVHLDEAAGGAWNGASEAAFPEGTREVLVWVPAGARVHRVHNATWGVAAPDALRLEPAPDATHARVEYDLAPSPYRLAAITLPQDYGAFSVFVRPGGGKVVEADGASATALDDGRFVARVADPRAGDAVALRAVDPERIGEVPVLAAVAGLSLLVLVGGIAWHRARPPLGGAEPLRFVDHLREIQARLLPPALAFAALNAVYFAVGIRMVAGPRAIPLPVPTFGTATSLSARAFAAFAERLVPHTVELVALRPVEAVLAQVQTTLFLALATALPLLLYEIVAFLAPAFTPRERRIARGTLPIVGGLLLAGALFGYLVMAPLMMRTLYAYAPQLGARPLLPVSDLVSFALVLVFAFALAFQLPVAMYALSRLGLVEARTFRKYARHAVVGIALAAGILTPDPSVVSQLIVAVPVTGLYLVGLGASALGEGRRARSADAQGMAS